MSERLFTLKGDIKLVKQLKRMEVKLAKKINKQAILHALKPIAAEAKKRTPVGKTKALKKSIGRRIKAYRNGNVVGIVGKKKKSEAAHFHLVLLGHRIAQGGVLRREKGSRKGQLQKKGAKEGRSIGRVKGNNWLSPVFKELHRKALAIYKSKLLSGIRESIRG